MLSPLEEMSVSLRFLVILFYYLMQETQTWYFIKTRCWLLCSENFPLSECGIKFLFCFISIKLGWDSWSQNSSFTLIKSCVSSELQVTCDWNLTPCMATQRLRLQMATLMTECRKGSLRASSYKVNGHQDVNPQPHLSVLVIIMNSRALAFIGDVPFTFYRKIHLYLFQEYKNIKLKSIIYE